MRPHCRERGAAAVEFALILPILLLLIGGIVDFGRAMFTQVIVTNSAREGARAAVVGVNSAGLQARAKAAAGPYSTSAGLVVSPIETCPSAPGPTDNASVTVTMSFDWILLGPALAVVGSSSVLPDELSASAAMHCGG